MSYAILRCEKIKTLSAVSKRCYHNERKYGPALSDQKDNGVIFLSDAKYDFGCKKYQTYSEFFHAKTEGQKIRKNACVGIEVICTFSNGGVQPDQLKDWAAYNLRFLYDKFGKENIFEVVLHTAEQTPHIHCVVIPMSENGKLSASSRINGPAHLRNLQTEYAERMAKFGLRRGVDKSLSKAEHRKLKDFYADEVNKATRLEAYEKTFGNEDDWTLDTILQFTENQQKAKSSDRDRRLDDRDLPLEDIKEKKVGFDR